jgi:nucleoside-triphosphatase
VPRILLTGPPRAGKTTLVSRLAGELAAGGFAVGGFLTREIREDGERVGFSVEEIGGRRALLAHVGFPEGPMVARYRVDVAAFEGLAVPAIERAAQRGGVVIIDELGQMELPQVQGFAGSPVKRMRNAGWANARRTASYARRPAVRQDMLWCADVALNVWFWQAGTPLRCQFQMGTRPGSAPSTLTSSRS